MWFPYTPLAFRSLGIPEKTIWPILLVTSYRHIINLPYTQSTHDMATNPAKVEEWEKQGRPDPLSDHMVKYGNMLRASHVAAVDQHTSSLVSEAQVD